MRPGSEVYSGGMLSMPSAAADAALRDKKAQERRTQRRILMGQLLYGSLKCNANARGFRILYTDPGEGKTRPKESRRQRRGSARRACLLSTPDRTGVRRQIRKRSAL